MSNAIFRKWVCCVWTLSKVSTKVN